MMAVMRELLTPVIQPGDRASKVRPDARRVELGLEGMTCAACATRIEKVLNRLPGVEAQVNFATETATAEIDPALTTTDQMLAAVTRAGYRASVHDNSAAERQEDQARKASAYRALKRDVIIAAA